MRQDPAHHDLSPAQIGAAASLLVDGLTGLPSHVAWVEILRVEESRRRRYDSSAGMILVELPATRHAEAHLTIAGEILTLAVRETDPVARVGERRLGVLAVPCDGGLDVLADRLRRQLVAEGITASVTARMVDPREDLTGAWQSAELSAARRLQAVN